MSEVGRQRKNLLFSGHGYRRLADNGKINHGKGMFGAAALTFPFQYTKLVKGHGDGQEKGNSDYGEICRIISFKS